jgi:hypothetical protein
VANAELLASLGEGAGELAAAVGEQQPGSARAVMLEDQQPLVARAEARPAQGAVDRARSEDEPGLTRQLDGQALRSPGRPGERQADPRPLDVSGDLGGPTPARLRAPGVEAIGPVAVDALFPAVEQRAREAELAAGSADVSELGGAPEGKQALRLYPVLEGHRTSSPVLVWRQELRRKAPLTLLCVRSEVSTPFGHSSA